MTKEVKYLKDLLDKLFILHKFRPELMMQYSIIKKRYDTELSLMKKKFYCDFIKNSKNKSKSVWEVVNTITNNKKKKT